MPEHVNNIAKSLWWPLLAVAALLALALWWWRGSARPSPTASTQQVQAAADFQQAFAPLHATVYDENAVFSGSQMSDDLQALEPLALRIGAESAELAQLHWLQSVVWGRRGGFVDQALHAGEQALALDAAAARLPPAELAQRHFMLANLAIEDGQWPRAWQHLQAASAAAQADAGQALTPRQRLGLREKAGYVLHELGRHREALAHNQQLLQDALPVLGPDNPALRTVLNNLAQNAYELKDLGLAARYLQERLRIAQAAQEHDTALDTLFQLGVLAHEQRQPEQARQWFTQRLALARASGSQAQQAQAQADLQELERRLAAAR